jgi:hypothetical protein
MTAARRPDSLDAETAILRQLAFEWERWNLWIFGRAMQPATFALGDGRHYLARWVPGPRMIEFSRAYVLVAPWGGVIEVLKHEMAHQYVGEVLRVADETAHGPAFRRVCQERGIDARAAGAPRTEVETEEARVIEKVSRLLTLANSPNLHEAESAARAARRLIVKYNLTRLEQPRDEDYTWRHLGTPSARMPGYVKHLAGLLTRHFFVSAILVDLDDPRGATGRVVEICGTEANVKMAEFVFEYVRQTAERLWQTRGAASGLAGQADRNSFLVGIVSGFSETLNRRDEESPSGTALVSLRDERAAGYLDRRHPRQRAARAVTTSSATAYFAGQAEGRGITLRKPVESKPGSGGGGLLGA